jgi:hypothetical protein
VAFLSPDDPDVGLRRAELVALAPLKIAQLGERRVADNLLDAAA